MVKMGTEYYYLDGSNQQGPLSFDHLCSVGIAPDTLVWREGLTDWTPASEVEELASLFRVQPPIPVYAPKPPKPPEPPKLVQRSIGKKHIWLAVAAIAIILVIVVLKNNIIGSGSGSGTSENVMTFTHRYETMSYWGQRQDAIIFLAGSGQVTIDWGDGIAQTHELSPFDYEYYYNNGSVASVNRYSHRYSNNSAYTVTITGKNVTYLGFDYNLLVMNIDVSGNKALTDFNCSNNRLTHLDVSKNSALTWLNCSSNQLTSLIISRRTPLTWLDCRNNQLSAAMLNSLFESLHSNKGGNLHRIEDGQGNLIYEGTKFIYIGSNTGENSSNSAIAERKGWTVVD